MKKILRLLGWVVLAGMVWTCNRPVAKFTYQGEAVAPADIEFRNESEKAERYIWHFGDGDTAMTANPTHVYGSSGNYAVRLEALQGNKSRTAEEVIQIRAPEKCLVEIQTSYGNMIVELYDATPLHRDNFTKLVEEGYYDSLLFHRVIEGFMIQGGDPESRTAGQGRPLGRGGPGYTVPAEFVDTLVHTKGALAAARTGDAVNPEKRSSGSQFYIVQGSDLTSSMLDRVEAQKNIRYGKARREAYLKLGGAPQLDREYTVFGRVIQGMEVIDEIAGAPTDPRDRPESDIRMKLRVIK
jgi:cyclophilin family peptidyl-prolyl cis-trans isomerase